MHNESGGTEINLKMRILFHFFFYFRRYKRVSKFLMNTKENNLKNNSQLKQ
jgi:hypothetical protein